MPNQSNWFYIDSIPYNETKEQRLERENLALRKQIEDLTASPSVHAVVIRCDETRMTVSTGPQTVDMVRPKLSGIEEGVILRMAAGDRPIVQGICESPMSAGNLLAVKSIIRKGLAEVQAGPDGRVVYFPSTITIEKGDRVVLDHTGTSIVRNYGKADSTHTFDGETGISWDDIGGLEEAKRDLIEAIEEPVRHKELYKKYGRRPVRGILLYGSPGNGKTLLAKACATSLAKIHGVTVNRSGFIYVKGPELLNMFVGNSEKNIRTLFDSAREHHKTNKYPAIIFIDEADAIMGKRGSRMGIEGMERTIVPQFLSEMDGLEDAGCMVLLATNRPDTLDPAIVREGRVDRKILVRRPTRNEASHIFELYLKHVPLAPGYQRKDLADFASDELFKDKHALYMLRVKEGSDRRFGLSNLVSGAKIASLVQDATQRALRRERDKDYSDIKLDGVCGEDLRLAILQSLSNERSLDHTADLSNFIEDEKLEITKVERVKP